MDEFAAVAASTDELQPVLDWVVHTVKQIMYSDEACVRLLEHGSVAGVDDPSLTQAMRLDRTMAFRREHGASSWPEPLAKAVMGYVLGGDRPLASPDLSSDPRFPELAGASGMVRAALVVPLKAENRTIGILAATETRPGRRWTADERRILVALACHSGFALERARLRQFRKRVHELEQWKEVQVCENDYAARLQRNLLPPSPLHLGGWEVAGLLRPAYEVGGDGFDLRRLDDDHLRFSVLDVAGKGMSAAIVMVAVQMLLREVCSSTGCMKHLMHRIDVDLTELHIDRMVTMFYADLEVRTGTLRYYRAGHTYPFLRRRDGSIEVLTEGGFPLGLGLSDDCAISETRIQPGDSLLVYSDGATDVSNPEQGPLGDERLMAMWQDLGALEPHRALEGLMRELRRHQGRASQVDDITLAALASRAVQAAA